MTNPFQSIAGTPESPFRHQGDPVNRNHLKMHSKSSERRKWSQPTLPPRNHRSALANYPAPSRPMAWPMFPTLRKEPQWAHRRHIGNRYAWHSHSDGYALALLNSHFFVGKNNQETGIFRINGDGSVTFVPPEQFKLKSRTSSSSLLVVHPNRSLPKNFGESSHRHERILVFKPAGTVERHEFNLWRGFGVEARTGWQKQRAYFGISARSSAGATGQVQVPHSLPCLGRPTSRQAPRRCRRAEKP